MSVYLRDLEVLLNGLGAEKVATAGMSMGGLMAMTLGATRPERVTRIVRTMWGRSSIRRGWRGSVVMRDAAR